MFDMHGMIVELFQILLCHLQKESQIYQDARTLEEFFEHLLEKWLPGYAYDSALPSDDESDSPPQKKFRRIVLPEWRELCAPSGSGVGASQHNESINNTETLGEKQKSGQ